MPDSTIIPKKPALSAPCRLYAILARDASVGVIFRRGPSKWVQVIHWDTATDTFTPGQWLHGRIWERLSDISPNGKLIIYFAQKHNARQSIHSWTAISKPPYLTALAFWPLGYANIGSGLFSSDTEVWLNVGKQVDASRDPLPQGLKVVDSGNNGGTEETIFFRRLERDGWRHVQEWQGELIQSDRHTSASYVTHIPSIHEKPHSNQCRTLVMTTTLTGFRHRYFYSIWDPEGRDEKLAQAEWADWDQRGRLVFARAGKIFAVASEAIGQEAPQEVVDLSGNKPEPMEAPDWAKVW